MRVRQNGSSSLHGHLKETNEYEGISPRLESSKGGKQGRTPTNGAPTAVTVTETSVAENSAVGTVVGVLGAQDPDPRETFSFALLDDAGGRFAIQDSNRLVVSDGGWLDYEESPSLTVVVKVTDKRGASFSQEIRIDLVDVKEPDAPSPSRGPTDILLSNNTVSENSAGGTQVGLLTAVDPDNTDTFIFTLVDDAGGRFAIDRNRLVVASGSDLDVETADGLSVTVEVSDASGSSYLKSFAIRILDAPDGEFPKAPDYVYAGLLPDGGGETSLRWNVGQPLGSSTTVTFCFLEAVPDYYGATTAEQKGFAQFTAEQRVVALDALRQIASFTAVTFVETSSDQAQITFGTADLPSGTGWAYLPGSASRVSGDVWIDNLVASNGDLTIGDDGYKTILHEIGHAMGLKHPHEAPALPDAEDSRKFTVMSYLQHPDTSARNREPTCLTILQRFKGYMAPERVVLAATPIPLARLTPMSPQSGTLAAMTFLMPVRQRWR